MTTHTRLLYKIFGITALLLSLSVSLSAAVSNTDPQARKIEAKADKAFIRGEFDRAMKGYADADAVLTSGNSRKYGLELKMARLYTMLQQPEKAIYYYGAVHAACDTMLTVNDVCFYIDALRQNNEVQKAEVVARKYAFKNSYNNNQRYMNTLNALANLQYYYAKDDSDFGVKLSANSTSIPEYWLGEWQNKPFYAASHSRVQDPLKIFYHRTQYFSLDNNAPMVPFKAIPRELQSGPVAFLNDGTMMIATGISYRKTDRIINLGNGGDMYVNQLYYSRIDPKRGGWSRFAPLFEQQQGFSYAHPAFFNNGKSLVFSSDRQGGYGGMDLYMCHWNEALQKWGDPINLGPEVNTEGDEAYPRIVEGALYFASNGHEGFGGYDIYRISFAGNRAIAGSTFHYPYPINSSYNDFGIYFAKNAGYFISDRRGMTGKDDIYTFDSSISPLGSGDYIGVSNEYTAMADLLNLITGLNSENTEKFEKDLLIIPEYVIPTQGKLLFSVYFDFNSSKLDSESTARLIELLETPGVQDVSDWAVIGYADDFGTWLYNKRLSDQRAGVVARFLTENGATPALHVEGRGQISLPATEYLNSVTIDEAKLGSENPKTSAMSYMDRIKINRKARRVDIFVK